MREIQKKTFLIKWNLWFLNSIYFGLWRYIYLPFEPLLPTSTQKENEEEVEKTMRKGNQDKQTIAIEVAMCVESKW